MFRIRHGFLRDVFLGLALISLLLPVTGCESVDTAMHNLKSSLEGMNISAPEVTHTNQGTYDANDDPDQFAAEAVYPTPRPDNAQITTVGEDALPPSGGEIIIVGDEMKADRETVFGLGGVGAGLAAETGNCPKVTAVKELNALHQFTNPDHPAPADRISSITLADLQSRCTRNDNNIVVEIDLTFEGELGPRARVWNTDTPSFAYPYFLAITSPSGTILAKEVFAAAVSFDKGQNRTVKRDSLRQIIPIDGALDGDNAIMIGFQLTDGELAYNRALQGTAAPRRAAAPALEPAAIETGAGTPPPAKPMTITPPRKPVYVATTKKPDESVKVESVVTEKTTSAVTANEAGSDAAPSAIEPGRPDTAPSTSLDKVIETVTGTPAAIENAAPAVTPLSSPPPAVDDADLENLLAEEGSAIIDAVAASSAIHNIATPPTATPETVPAPAIDITAP